METKQSIYTKQTMILYTILGIVSFFIAYISGIAARASSTIPDNTTQSILILVFVCTLLMGVFFFIPVVTMLVLLAKKN